MKLRSMTTGSPNGKLDQGTPRLRRAKGPDTDDTRDDTRAEIRAEMQGRASVNSQAARDEQDVETVQEEAVAQLQGLVPAEEVVSHVVGEDCQAEIAVEPKKQRAAQAAELDKAAGVAEAAAAARRIQRSQRSAGVAVTSILVVFMLLAAVGVGLWRSGRSNTAAGPFSTDTAAVPVETQSCAWAPAVSGPLALAPLPLAAILQLHVAHARTSSSKGIPAARPLPRMPPTATRALPSTTAAPPVRPRSGAHAALRRVQLVLASSSTAPSATASHTTTMQPKTPARAHRNIRTSRNLRHRFAPPPPQPSAVSEQLSSGQPRANTSPGQGPHSTVAASGEVQHCGWSDASSAPSTAQGPATTHAAGPASAEAHDYHVAGNTRVASTVATKHLPASSLEPSAAVSGPLTLIPLPLAAILQLHVAHASTSTGGGIPAAQPLQRMPPTATRALPSATSSPPVRRSVHPSFGARTASPIAQLVLASSTAVAAPSNHTTIPTTTPQPKTQGGALRNVRVRRSLGHRSQPKAV